MVPSTKLEDKFEGLENFLDQKYRVGLILKENGFDKYIKDEIAKPKEDEAKEKHEQDLIKEMRIIVDSIKDHLIPQVSSRRHLSRCMIHFPECMREGTSKER